MSKAASSSSGGAVGACMLDSSASIGRACAAVLAGGGVEDWLKTGNIPTTVATQVEIHCLQEGSTSWVQEVENARQNPRGTKNRLYQRVPVGVCHPENRAAGARQELTCKTGTEEGQGRRMRS